MSAALPLYHLQDVSKLRQAEGIEFRLKIPKLTIRQGERVAVIGQSGCGKSTLLDLLAMVLQPDEAEAFTLKLPNHRATDLRKLWQQRNQDQLANTRKREIGYILQTGGLLPFLRVRDNISLSRRLLGMPDDDHVATLTERLGISAQMNKYPGTLSAGQRQRVAIARALAHKPSIVIADEPTASLDPITAKGVMDLFIELVRDSGITLIIATHDWGQVERHDLRKLEHHTEELPDGRGSHSIFQG